VAKKFRSQPSAGKIMLTLFGNMEGSILVYFTPKGETVNSQNCCDVNSKQALRGRRFLSDEEVIGAVQNCLKTQRKKTFSDGIKKHIKH
jgi:hypothetical protein